MFAGLDFGVLREKETWQAFGIGVVLFCIIGYSSLTLFGLSASAYGVSDEVVPVPDFEVETMNRTGIDDVVADENGMVRLSDLRGMACGYCHSFSAPPLHIRSFSELGRHASCVPPGVQSFDP